MPFEWQIGWRLVRARRSGFVSFIAGVAMLGIALGVAALIVVLSVVNGFQREVRDRMLAVVPHVELQDRGSGLPAPEALRAQPGVAGAAPFATLATLLGRGDSLRGALVRGIDPVAEPQVSLLAERLGPEARAALRAGSGQVVLGQALARQLQLKPGDALTLVRPAEPGEDAPRFVPLQLAATFDSGHYEFDSTLALMPLADVAALGGLAVTRGVSLRLADAQAAPEVAARLRAQLGPGAGVSDWTRTNRQWFESVQIQKRMIGLILTLIVAVAAFNLMSMMVMTVTNRRGDIAILRTLGASPASVMGIFVVQGAASGVVGTLGGLLLGLLLAFNLDRIVPLIEAAAGRPLLDAQVYLIDHLPSDPRPDEVAWIAGVSVALAVLATLYPSWRAARQRPAEALRDE